LVLAVLALCAASVGAQSPSSPRYGAAVGGSVGVAPPWFPVDGSSSAAPPPTHLLHFVVESGAGLADPGATLGVGGSVLGRLVDTEIAVTAPGLWLSARKQHAQSEWLAAIGDDDWDGDFWEEVGGEIDALALRPDAPDSGPLQLEHWIFSTEHPWGLANPLTGIDAYGALDGTLFSLRRAPDGTLEAETFLTEAQLLKSLGQGSDPLVADVDVDALAIDAIGNIFLSFRSTELVHGTSVADDGVVCIPESRLFYGPDGNVLLIEEAGATIVCDKPQTDAWVQHAGLVDASGKSIKILADLTGLSIDPAGGTFAPAEPIPGLPDGAPNLCFTGTRLGPMVLSTRDGGELARLNGKPLGAPVISGVALGLDAASTQDASADLCALHVTTARELVPRVEVEEGQLYYQASAHAELLLDGFAPNAWVWLMLDAELPSYGENSWAQPYSGPGCSQRLAWGTGLQFPLPTDSKGRARVVMPSAVSVGHSLRVLAQAFDVGTARLSRPATVWCDHGGALAGDPLPD